MSLLKKISLRYVHPLWHKLNLSRKHWVYFNFDSHDLELSAI